MPNLADISIEVIAPNLTKLRINGLGWIAFSYKTPIAFSIAPDFAIRENEWNTTTGKHLNSINSDKSIRISGDEFMEKMRRYKLNFSTK